MTKNYAIAIFTTLFTLIAHSNSYAADSLNKKNPEAVLVQLRSEHNRIQALTEARKYAEVALVKDDALSVAEAMTRDFHDHFNFCPVYYYMDTNANLVKQKRFDGVLMNADLTPAKNLVINDSSKKYLVVYYGYPVPQSRSTDVVTNPESYTYDQGEHAGKGLVICNSHLYQISFLYKFDYDNFLFRLRNDRKYIYLSHRYDMEYFPFAKEFSGKLWERNDKINISHVNSVPDLLFDKE